MGGNNFYPFYTILYVISLFFASTHHNIAVGYVSQGVLRYIKVSQRRTEPNVSEGILRYIKVFRGIPKRNKSKCISRYLKVSQGISKNNRDTCISRYIKVS